MSRTHRLGRSFAAASAALILVAGATFAHDAVVDTSTTVASASQDGDDLDHFQVPDVEEQDATVDDGQHGDVSDQVGNVDNGQQGDAAENDADLDHFQQGDPGEQAGDNEDGQPTTKPAKPAPTKHHVTTTKKPSTHAHSSDDQGDAQDGDHQSGGDHQGGDSHGGGDSGGEHDD